MRQRQWRTVVLCGGCTLCVLIAAAFAVWVWCFRLGIRVDDDLIIAPG